MMGNPHLLGKPSPTLESFVHRYIDIFFNFYSLDPVVGQNKLAAFHRIACDISKDSYHAMSPSMSFFPFQDVKHKTVFFTCTKMSIVIL